MVKSANEYLKIFLVRHGETNWNAGNRVAEAEQQNMTGKAAAQIAAAARVLQANAAGVEAVYASTENRAVGTARIVVENAFPASPLIQTALLNERDYGKQQPAAAPVGVGGNHTPYAYADYAELSEREKWLWKPYPDFESDEEIRRRFLRFTDELRAARRRCVIAATHGGFIRIALMHAGLIAHRDWENFGIGNGTVYELEINGAAVNARRLSRAPARRAFIR